MVSYTQQDLIDEPTGRINRVALRAMCARRCDPAVVRFPCRNPMQAFREHYRDLITALQCDWKIRRGIPVPSTLIRSDSNATGVRRSAF